MEIIIAKSSGFCFGVKKALETTLQKLDDRGDKVYSLGPLIHNKQAIDRLSNRGLSIINDIEEGRNSNVIIRSHGVPLKIYEQAVDNNINIIDCTCPFVRKIQNKVNEYLKKDYQIIIIGDPEHPEVIGINGWCNDKAYIINSKEDIEQIPKCDKICVVAQTTITKEKFESLSQDIAKKGTIVEIFNTICNATNLRQESCEEVAKQVDAMIVIGGYHSSNTQKLALISKEYCKNTFHIETVEELPLEKIKGLNKIGITAGASTPEWIIKEVINKMNNNDNKMSEMLEAIENSMIRIHRGDIVKGTVILISDDEVMVNIGYKSDGIIKRDELSNDPSVKPRDILSIGDEIEVYIANLDDGEGNVLLSKKRVDALKGWDELEEINIEGKTVSCKVTEVVNGGLIAVVKGVRGFIPASHVSARFVENLNSFVGNVFDVRVIEIDKDKKRVILSRKLVEREELDKIKYKTWDAIEKGKVVEGEVKRLADFGAFVDIGGVDGLVHISDLSWDRVTNPRDIVKEGDKVEVVILDFDKDKGKISLGLKQTIPHPWDNITNKYKVGDVVEGTVVKFMDFGAFVKLEAGVDGLVHISQISTDHIAKPSDKLKVGQKVNVKVLEIKEEEKRISLSIKEVDNVNEDVNANNHNEENDITIGDILKEK